MKTSLGLGLGAILTLIFVAPTLAQDTAKQIERGKAVYTAQKCALCHAIAGKGNAKGALDDVGNKLTAAEIRQWITSPAEMAAKAKADRKPPMKAYASLPKDDLDALVAYLQTLKKK